MSRYLTSAIEQALWSLMNLGVNLLLIRIAAPDQYGAFALWANVAFVLSSVQNALTLTHVMVLPPGAKLDPARLPVEQLMLAVTALFWLATAGLILVITVVMGLSRHELGTPAAALFVPAFLIQQYFRTLAYSRGVARDALLQTLGVLMLAFLLVGGGAAVFTHLSADTILLMLGGAYGLVGLAAGGTAIKGQDIQFGRDRLAGFGAYVTQSGWLFLGVSTTEILTRFYAFAVAGSFGATALASLSATQLFLRPVPLLGSSWGLIARSDLVKRKEHADWAGFTNMVLLALGLGLVVAAIWTGMVFEAWGQITSLMFKGKYAQDGWMVLLWGLSTALSLVQMVISIPLQVLQAFKPLAIANTVASTVAALAILLAMKVYGFGGAIAGTAVGQCVEVAIMASILWAAIRRAQSLVR